MKARLALVALAMLALAACGNPWPTTGSRPPEHRTILVVGDSLAGQNDVALPIVLAAQGIDATVIDAHQNGSGLIGPVGDQPTALAYVKAQLAAFPTADTVLIEWAGACAECGAGTYPAYGSPAFLTQWGVNAHAIVDAIHAAGMLAVWAEAPPVGVSSITAASGSQVAVETTLVISQRTKADFAPYASAGVVDWSTALTNTGGQYATTLWYDGAWHQVRTDDLVHLTMDGAVRTSTWTARGLTDLWAANPVQRFSTQTAQPRLIEAGDPVTLG